ncbi:MAG: M14 family zinc carboxypeptidase [Thermoflexibacteraceae bacterium]
MLLENYEQFKEKSITHKWLRYSHLQTLLGNLPKNLFEVTPIGKSIEQRPIYQVKIGTGSTKVLLWSQMHGNESTATMALFDMFNFFASKDTENQALRNSILTNCTLYFIPMLNPDGAEVWKRQTAVDIDMNRDAVALQTPEAQLLKHLQQTLQPEFGFNLHDQSIEYSVGFSPNPATISYLAPAPDEAKTVTPPRQKAMQLIAEMDEVLQKILPNKAAKFSDAFEPRAFGDNIQKWGTSTVLLESGGYYNDTDKQYIRQLNYVLLLTALQSIATRNYEKYSEEQYNAIPFNEKRMKAIILRNVALNTNGFLFRTDISLMQQEVFVPNAERLQSKLWIDDIGDLSTFYGYQEIDCKDLQIEILAGKIALNETPKLVLRDSTQQIVFTI